MVRGNQWWNREDMLWCSCLLLLALAGVATAQAPTPPSNLRISAVSDRSVSYAFTASPTPGATYRVAITTQTPGIPQPTDDRTDSASLRTKAGLIPDVDYTIQVFAVQNGAESTAISDDFTTDPGVPSGPPQNLRVSSRNTNSITLTWSDPALVRINDRDGVRRFVVRRNGVQVANITAKTYTFTGLSVATSYNFEVLAINDQGIAPNNHAARLTATTASGVPSSPTLRVVLPRFSNAYLVWSDPEPFAGEITGFQIRYLIDFVPQTIPELDGWVFQYSVSGIKNSKGRTHSVSLRAKTAAGYGPYSDPVEFTFQPIAEVDVTAVDCTTLKVNYTVNPLPGGDKNKASLQSFVVTYQPILGGGSTVTRTVPLNGNSAEGVLCLSGLTADTLYRVTYRAEVMTTLGITVPSDIPNPVEILTARECDQLGQCIVTPSSTTITSTPPVADSTSAAVTPSSTTITSTPPVTDSTSAVVAPSSTTASARPSTSPTPGPTVDPQTPTGVSVSTPPVTDNAIQITLMWSKPGSDSGLTGYQIQYSWKSKWDPSRVVKRQSERKTMSVNVTDTSYTLQDAEGFAEYCFAVSALYEGGEESPATAELCTTTPETKPSPPLNLCQVHSSVTTSSVRLQWDAPDRPNGNIKHFKVYYQQGSSRQYQVSDWQGQGYVVLDGLDPDTEYYVNVTAVTDTLESDTSNGLRMLTLPVAALPDRGEVIVTIITALLLLVFTNAVSVVVTFLCTRRCYRKKTSSPGPPPPEEKCDHYEAVELDNVQMQICPAYASVDEAKSS